MKIIKALESLDGINQSIFLAGPSPRGEIGKDWRPEVILELEQQGFTGTVISPVNDNFKNSDYDNQIEWEQKAMSLATKIIFWIPRSETMPAFTTNIEFGEYLHSGKIICGSPENAVKNRYLQDRFRKLGGTWYTNINSLVKETINYFKTPPTKKFATADLHFGETRLDILGRPFRDQMDMVEQLINSYNSVVGINDDVYIIGDVCYQKTPEFLKYVERLNGNKILIRGNHEKVFTDEQLKPYFSRIIEDGGGVDIDIKGIQCYMTHYPTMGKINKFNLVGHIHSAWKYQLNMFNIGIDANHFLPVDLDTIPFHLNAITNFYDEDVWVAYKAVNMLYIQKRGVKNTYFKSKI